MDYGQVEKLDDINGGIVRDLFPDALNEVLQNIGDENTPAEFAREITIKVKMKPTKDREVVASSVTVTTKLAAPKVSEALLMLSSDGVETTAHFRLDEPEQEVLPLEFPKVGN